jgi:O-antigen/teichoic acid export membrane protein
VPRSSDRSTVGREANHGGAGGKHARPRQSRLRSGAGFAFADKDSLRGKASRAFGWSFASSILTRVGTFGIGIMLARLLGPHAFGIYAVAFVALLAMQTFNELGVSLAIVRWEEDPSEIIPTVTTISLFVSVLTYVGCFFSAPAYASAMGAPGATNVVRVLAVGILIDGFCNTPTGVLQREFRQRHTMIAIQVGGWLGTGVTVALAWSGHGAMSLALGYVAGASVVAALLVMFVPESLRIGFDRAKARALLRFGLPLAGSNLITLAIANVDQVIVGHMLGAQTLGFYVLALNVASWPISVFSRPVASVAPAVFSRLQSDGFAMRSTFLSVAGLLGAVAMPACLVIGGSATPLISFLYGARWLPAVEPVLWLALLGAMRVFFLLAYDYLVVLRRSRFLLIVQLVWLAALIPALTVGTHADGIYGAGLAEAVVAAFVVLPFYLGGLRTTGMRLRALSRHLWWPGTGAAAAGLVAVVASRFAPNDFAAVLVSGVAAVVIIGLLAYRMRAVLSVLRPASAEQAKPSETTVSAESPIPGQGEITAELRAIWGVVEGPSTRNGNRALRDPVWQDALLASTRCALTGPLPMYRDLPISLPPRRDLSATSPLYRITVTSMQWDPAGTARQQLPQNGSHPINDRYPDNKMPDTSIASSEQEPLIQDKLHSPRIAQSDTEASARVTLSLSHASDAPRVMRSRSKPGQP